MDARYFRERAETCLRLAKELPWNNPGRFQLMDTIGSQAAFGTELISIIGALYIIVRGLDHIDKGLPIQFRDKWDWWFPKHVRA